MRKHYKFIELTGQIESVHSSQGRTPISPLSDNARKCSMTCEDEPPYYSPLMGKTSAQEHKSRKWTLLVLILSLILAAEVIITAFLLYHLAGNITKTYEAASAGEYPLYCLQQLVDPDYQENSSQAVGGLASCNLWADELQNTVHKQLISDIRNTLYQELAASNMTVSQFRKPAIHLGAEHELRQFSTWVQTGQQEQVLSTADTLHWDNMNALSVQQGLMGYTRDGRVVIPRQGLYFVYSQVYFQLPLSAPEDPAQHFLQYVYRQTASYPTPILLSKAVVNKCRDSGLEEQLFSSHQGALYHLQRGDSLYLQVPNIKAVRLQEETTFFGAFMVV